MAIDNLLTRLIAQAGTNEARNYLSSHNAPPSYDDVLHDGLVGSGELLGTSLGTVAGGIGGGAIGGPFGAVAGRAVLAPAGALAGAWAAHGAYREGELIRNILSHPENWTVDAAGAIVPAMPAPNPPSDTENGANDADGGYLRRLPNVAGGPSPAAPPSTPPQGPLSLNDAYLEYLRRLNAHQSQASAIDARTPAASSPAALQDVSRSTQPALQSGYARAPRGIRRAAPLGRSFGWRQRHQNIAHAMPLTAAGVLSGGGGKISSRFPKG